MRQRLDAVIKGVEGDDEGDLGGVTGIKLVIYNAQDNIWLGAMKSFDNE